NAQLVLVSAPEQALDANANVDPLGHGAFGWVGSAVLSVMPSAKRRQGTMVAPTYAALALGKLGIPMGWPRLRNTLAGWHKGTAWFLLPLVILSPLTGLESLTKRFLLQTSQVFRPQDLLCHTTC